MTFFLLAFGRLAFGRVELNNVLFSLFSFSRITSMHVIKRIWYKDNSCPLGRSYADTSRICFIACYKIRPCYSAREPKSNVHFHFVPQAK